MVEVATAIAKSAKVSFPSTNSSPLVCNEVRNSWNAALACSHRLLPNHISNNTSNNKCCYICESHVYLSWSPLTQSLLCRQATPVPKGATFSSQFQRVLSVKGNVTVIVNTNRLLHSTPNQSCLACLSHQACIAPFLLMCMPVRSLQAVCCSSLIG